VSDSEEVATPPSRPRVVENRFGISEAGPLPDDHEPMTAAREATPAAGFVPRPPDPTRFEQKRPRLGDLDLRDRVDMDRATGRFDSASHHEEEEEGSFANVLDDQSEQIDIPRYADVDESGFPLVREPAALSQELDAGFDELMREESQPVDINHAPVGGWTDLSDDLAEIRFYLDQGLDDDARAAIEALGEDHPGHPQLAALSREIDAARAEKVSFDSGSKPLLDLVTEEDQEADAYLSAIFAGGKKTKKQAPPAEGRVEVTAVASEGESNARDHFDLGTAYREMGLVDGAIAEFEAAATDPNWKSRALVMVAILQSSRGDNNEAIGLLEHAIEAATSDAERCEAMYELAVLFEKLGDKMAAIEQFEAVEQGYRDRDERLVALQG
jgi:tetratricopeptide (TPR) repeat protein